MDRLSTLLLQRSSRVHLPVGNRADDGFVDHLEIDLAERGWVLDATARSAFTTMEPTERTAWADWLLASIEAEVGADRPHVPLFRRFPDTTPADTGALFVERMISWLLQSPDQPCVLCGTSGSVAPVSPCGHLVCRSCFDGADYSACPICRRRIDADDPFLRVTEPTAKPAPGAPLRLRVAVGRADKLADATELRDSLTSRLAPLSDADRGDLALLVESTTTPGDLSWLPEVVPARETLAYVLAMALRDATPDRRAETAALAAARWGTATDIARTLWVLAGGGPGLVLPRKPKRPQEPIPASEAWRPAEEPAVEIAVPRVPAIGRPLRRAVLASIDRLDLTNAVEDVLRHRTIWKRVAERLRPFEHAEAFPKAAVCFAVLRDTTHPLDSAVGRAILAAAESGQVKADLAEGGVRARAITFASRVEALLAEGDSAAALDLLSTRPGDFLRRLDHLARITPPEALDALGDAAGRAARTASPTVALAAFASLAERDRATAPETARQRVRLGASEAAEGAGASSAPPLLPPRHGRSGPAAPDASEPRRVFFPRGDVARAKSIPDRRALLPEGAPDRIRSSMALGLTHRALGLDRFDVAVVDAALAGFPIPSRSQAAAGASRTIPRGASIALPGGDTIRLFLHWTQPEGMRVDLDLSAVFFDDGWGYLGHCDYTDMRPLPGAVHSGDLTSAPAPSGATEFLDLDVSTLAAAGIAHIAAVVFSFTDTPFEALDDAFAGFAAPSDRRSHFDPARVALRFDLQGDSRITVPMIFHTDERTMRWTDLHLGSSGYGHSVSRYSANIAQAGQDMELAYGGGRRPTLLDLAAIHAAARAREVWVRHADATFSPVSAAGAAGFEEIRSVAAKPGEGEAGPDLDGQRLLFAAADQLPEDVRTAGSGSVLVAATTGDPLANAGVTDLIDCL